MAGASPLMLPFQRQAEVVGEGVCSRIHYRKKLNGHDDLAGLPAGNNPNRLHLQPARSHYSGIGVDPVGDGDRIARGIDARID